MERIYNDLDITFNPKDERLGQISFSFSEEEVQEALGKPAERELHYYTPEYSPGGDEAGQSVEKNEPIQYSVNMFYPSFAVFIGYEGQKFQGASIHLDDLILDGKRFSEMNKKGILECIKNYHTNNDIEFDCYEATADGIKEEYYEFANIGLAIWFKDEDITNICVQDKHAWER